MAVKMISTALNIISQAKHRSVNKVSIYPRNKE